MGEGKGMPPLEAVQLRCEGSIERLEAPLSVAVSIGAGVSGGESHRCSYTACDLVTHLFSPHHRPADISKRSKSMGLGLVPAAQSVP